MLYATGLPVPLCQVTTNANPHFSDCLMGRCEHSLISIFKSGINSPETDGTPCMKGLNSWQHLTAADLAPVEAPPFVLRAGLTPTWGDWREGRFAERKDMFGLLWKSFIAWREGVAEQEPSWRQPLPVFWIEGWPGDG